MKKVKRFLTILLTSVITAGTFAGSVSAYDLSGLSPSKVGEFDYRLIFDPEFPVDISLTDEEVWVNFPMAIEKGIVIELEDSSKIEAYDLKYKFDKLSMVHLYLANVYIGNAENTYVYYGGSAADENELSDYANQLRGMDGIVKAETFIGTLSSKGYLTDASKEKGLTVYIKDLDNKAPSLDELKADKELSEYVDSIGGTITAHENGLSCITGIADREKYREILSEINSFEIVDKRAMCPYFIYQAQAYETKLLEHKFKGDINDDGKITAADASIAFSAYKKNYTSGGTGLSELDLYNADFNGDGEVTAEDASGIFSQYKKTYQS